MPIMNKCPNCGIILSRVLQGNIRNKPRSIHLITSCFQFKPLNYGRRKSCNVGHSCSFPSCGHTMESIYWRRLHDSDLAKHTYPRCNLFTELILRCRIYRQLITRCERGQETQTNNLATIKYTNVT